jgi:outer membrane protein
MKKAIALSLLMSVSTALPALAAPPGPPANPALPVPKIVVLDQNQLFQLSKVGQDITRQVQSYSVQAKADLQGQAKALQAQGAVLQQQVAILAPDVKAQKIKDFESRQAGLQGQAQKKESMIQGGFIQARQAVSQALEPILRQLMQQRGANIVLEKGAVMFATDPNFDITPAAIAMLNQKLPSYKVQLVALPAGVQPQQ